MTTTNEESRTAAPPYPPSTPDRSVHAAGGRPLEDDVRAPLHTSDEQRDRPAETSNCLSPGGSDTNTQPKRRRRISEKTKRRLYWLIPLLIFVLILAILFEVYKSDFERWVSPLADWLRERESWSWVIPVAILFVLSFPPLFGHEIVQIVVGLTYPLGVAIGIACAGAVLGEAGCFVLFKYCFTGYVEKRVRQRVKWAAIARVAQEAGFRGVLVIRYSIVPPHLANPLFACTGMKFWLYMTTVVLSLPKSIVFVALGTPSAANSKGAKAGKIVAIAVVVIVTLFASRWIRRKTAVATKEIEAERAMAGIQTHEDEELGVQGQNQK